MSGMSGFDLAGPWRKATFSDVAHGACVELAPLTSGDVALRNSRDPHGAVMVFTQTEIAAFIAGARAGEFDDLA